MPIRPRRALALAAVLVALAPLAADPSSGDGSAVDRLLVSGAAGATREMEADELDRLLQYGASGSLTIFEVFNQVIVALAARGERAAIPGDVLRAAAARYDLGGERVASLLPVAKVALVTLGSGRPGEAGELEVLLQEEHAQYLELADIKLSSRYGFEEVRPGLFSEGFGASVRRLIFSFNLESLELYEPNKIAIHVKSLPQPKRWRIPRITPK